jgi:5'(3')-deoxyribonucleotidase
LQQVLQDQDFLCQTVNSLTKRSKTLEKLLQNLEEKPFFCKDLLGIMKEAMQCKNISVFSCINNSATLELTLSKDEEAEVFKDIAEFSCFISKKTLNIKDITMEPLFNGKQLSECNSCLVVPFKVRTGQQFVVIYKREKKEFSNLDLDFSDRLTSKFSQYSQLFSTSKVKFYHVDLSQLYENFEKFSIPVTSSTFDFYQLFSSIKEVLIQFLSLNSCSIYVADHRTNQLWTKNSNSSSSLFFPFSEKTLIGYCYLNRQIVFLPSSVSEIINDLEAFHGKKVLAAPILSDFFENTVLGVILCIRTNAEFSSYDLDFLTFYMQSIARLLEGIYSFHIRAEDEEPLVSPRYVSSLVSPKSLFREINLRNSERRFSN